MKTAMVVGAGLLQVPAYEIARRLGIRTIAIDRDPGAPGMRAADAAYAVDTRDTAGVLQVARRERVNAVLTLCTDAPVLVVAAVAEALGLPGISPTAALAATNKIVMREALARARVPIPAFRKCTSFEDVRAAAQQVGLPAILKPPASSGSRGVFKVSNLDQLEAAYSHTRSVVGDRGAILVEEFIEGTEVSIETLTFGGSHHVVAITDKRTTGDPHWVETGHVQPSRHPHTVQAALERVAHAALSAVGVDDAAGHIEIKLGNDGPRVIELGARLGGDFISTELVPRSTGVDMVAGALRIAFGEAPDLSSTRSRGAAIRYVLGSPGKVAVVHGVQEASMMPGVVRVEVMVQPGDVVGGVASSVDRPGFVVAEGSDAVEAEERASAAADRIRIRSTPA